MYYSYLNSVKIGTEFGPLSIPCKVVYQIYKTKIYFELVQSPTYFKIAIIDWHSFVKKNKIERKYIS